MRRVIAVVVVMASACVALQLSWTSQAAVVITNNPYTFLAPGGMSFTVNPLGSADDDTIQSITLSGNCSSQWALDLTLDGQPVPGARVCGGAVVGGPSGVAPTDDLVTCPSNYTFGVNFAGTQPGTSTCLVDVYATDTTGSGAGSALYQLSLTGIGAAASGITVSPSTIDFKDVPQTTTSSPVPVTVTNIGTTGVTVTGTLTGATYGVTPGNYTSFSLAGGAQATFNVTCTPPGTSSYPGQLGFAGGGSSDAVMLTCNGISSTITITPTQVTFDSTLVGKPPANKMVTITGPNTATLDMIQLDATAQGAGVSIVGTNPQGSTIGGGKTVTLGYSAAAIHESGPLGTLMVKASSDSMTRNVSVSGEALLGGIGTNPSSVEFGAVCVGASSRKDIEVYANEAGAIILQSVMAPPAPFSATPADPLPKTLLGNHSGPSAQVAVMVQSSTPGDQTGNLVLVSNVPMKEMTEVAVHSVILEGGIAATPTEVHFGSVMPGMTTGIKQVQLSNCGTTDLMFNAARIVGTNPGEFTLIGANPPRTLHPTESETFMVVMQPHSNGLKTAQLVLDHSAGQTSALLDGEGFNGSAKDRETYYACHAGRPAGAWPIALALLGLRLRRRKQR